MSAPQDQDRREGDSEAPLSAPDPAGSNDVADAAPADADDAAEASAPDEDAADAEALDTAPLSEPPGQSAEHNAPENRRRDRKRDRYALVYAQDLTKVYRLQRGLFREPTLLRALDSVSFYVRRHETFGVVGESGCGKSTLGRCLLRLTEPTMGRIVFDRKDVTALSSAELRALRRRMQIVFQDPYASLNPMMTVRDAVREGLQIFNLRRGMTAANARVDELLDMVGLSLGLASRLPHELSGGQRQRVALARALAVEPDFLVLDEPTSALDLPVQAQILNLLQDLQEDLGISMLFISHDLRTVQFMSHRIGVMYLGRMVEIGPSHAVVNQRFHPYTRALFGAMPKRVDGRGKQLQMVLEGEPPSPLNPPDGCAFYSRCPQAEEGLCNVRTPPLEEPFSGAHHRVACWHPHVD